MKTLDRTTRDKIKRLRGLAERSDWDDIADVCSAALDEDWPSARQALAWHKELKEHGFISGAFGHELHVVSAEQSRRL